MESKVYFDTVASEWSEMRKAFFSEWMGFEREDIKNWFVEAGLTAVSVDDAGGNCCTDACQTAASASVSIFVASGEKR